MISFLFLILGWFLATEAATNISVAWNDTSGYLSYFPLPEINTPNRWLANGFTDSNDSISSSYVYNGDPGAAVMFVFTGSDLFYSAPLWPVQIKLLMTIAQYDTPDGDGEVDGVLEVRKIISLTDPNVTNPATSLGNATGNGDFTQPVGLLTGRHLPYGTWNVTVQVIDDANLGILNAFGSFMYTQLNDSEIAALDPTDKLPPQQLYVPASNSSSIPSQVLESEQRASRTLTTGILVGSIFGGVGFVALVGALWYLRIRRRRRVKFIIDTDDQAPSTLKSGNMFSNQKQSYLAPVPFTSTAPSSLGPAAEHDLESLSSPLIGLPMTQKAKTGSLKTITRRYGDGEDNISIADSEITRANSPESSTIPPSRLWQFDRALPTVRDNSTPTRHHSARFVDDQDGRGLA